MNQAMLYGPHARILMSDGRYAFYGVTTSRSLKSFDLEAHGSGIARPERVVSYANEEGARFGVSPRQIFGKGRRRAIIEARHSVIKRLRDDGFSTVQIGRWMGRDHSTVLHALGKGAA